MKIHIITIGKPKLPYAIIGWDEYWSRLSHYHQLQVSHINDKNNNYKSIQPIIKNNYVVALEITGKQLTSYELATFLEKRAIIDSNICFIIGGPDGLPKEIIKQANFLWSFSHLTFPHDLAMVILLESLYRASTIISNQPYHR